MLAGALILALFGSALVSPPQYIRCVKPNPHKAQLAFEGQMVYEQLQYAGVFEAITIRKQGFPFRLTHQDFFQRYKCLFPNTHRWSANVVENCKTLIAEMKQSLALVQIGTTKVLYRAEQHRDMELRRNLAVEEVTVFIQKHVSSPWFHGGGKTIALRMKQPGRRRGTLISLRC